MWLSADMCRCARRISRAKASTRKAAARFAKITRVKICSRTLRMIDDGRTRTESENENAEDVQRGWEAYGVNARISDPIATTFFFIVSSSLYEDHFTNPLSNPRTIHRTTTRSIRSIGTILIAGLSQWEKRRKTEREIRFCRRVITSCEIVEGMI